MREQKEQEALQLQMDRVTGYVSRNLIKYCAITGTSCTTNPQQIKVMELRGLQLTTHTHTHPFNGPFSGTTRVSRYQKGKTNLDFTEAGDSEWQWHQLGNMQVCTSLQTDDHASTPPLSFLQAGYPSCRPTNSVKALKAWCSKLPTLTIWVLPTGSTVDEFVDNAIDVPWNNKIF